MREIKFRAWDEPDKMMYYGVESGIRLDDGSEYAFNDILSDRGYHKWVLMQLIGICDKDGKEIYEGDIVEYQREAAKIAAVTYDESIAAFVFGEDEIGDNIHNIEVVGNIYEKLEKP